MMLTDEFQRERASRAAFRLTLDMLEKSSKDTALDMCRHYHKGVSSLFCCSLYKKVRYIHEL